jgi:hypothetical protein
MESLIVQELTILKTIRQVLLSNIKSMSQVDQDNLLDLKIQTLISQYKAKQTSRLLHRRIILRLILKKTFLWRINHSDKCMEEILKTQENLMMFHMFRLLLDRCLVNQWLTQFKNSLYVKNQRGTRPHHQIIMKLHHNKKHP